MIEADLSDIRRLRLHTVAIRGLDDLIRPSEYRVRPEVATRAVRRLRVRGGLMLLSGLALVVGFITGATVLEDRAAGLEATGVRVPGVVVQVRQGFVRGVPDSIEVRFAVDGTERVRSMNLNDGSPVLNPGDEITVFYDRDDPERIGAPGVPNDPFWAFIPMVIAFVLGTPLSVAGAIGYGRWRRRARALRRSGWRPGRAVTVRSRVVTIQFDDPADGRQTIVMTRPVMLPIPREIVLGPVLVGGSRRRLTVLFVQGPVLAAAKPRSID
ncbi:DUF3592 domain-containing protein [Crossiella sp. CA-258035]|uniref:DUF3592 domain-containing protein n=1 Tax=Crossiella sp. CA-258035 TaxID=2981138 RepID=UPI0024BD30D4|nr:DUF3592 domain-containing protein [Crossiella sp. CA-258035]WHT20253.1 DUF3592 domain-containing protein [Crossiella sp. CA-258035]